MPLEADEIRATLRELIDTWHGTAVPVEMRVRTHSLIGLTVYGLTAHTYVLAEGVLTLDAAHQPRAATPLIRQALECAITAQWVELAGYPAALALLHDQARNSKNTIGAFAAAGFDVAPELVERLAADLAAAFETKTSAGRVLEQRCKEIQGATALYATYRQMSATCHAGSDVVDLYVHQIERTPTNPLGAGLATLPKAEAADAALGMMLVSVMTATSAWSRIDARHTHRTRMKQLHRRLGTAYEKHLSDEGFRLQQQRERELKAWARTLAPDSGA